MAIRHELPGDDGLALWDEVSRRSDHYDPGACRTRWDGFGDASGTPVTVGSLVFWIREEDPDYQPPRRPRDGGDDANAGGNGGEQPIKITSWAERLQANPNPQYRQAVIDGLARRGEVVTVVSGVKVGKSWMAMQLAICVAAGRPWMGMEVRRGRVLLVDCELHQETLDVRLKKVAEVMGVDPHAVAGNVDVVCLRGTGLDITDVERRLLNQHGPGHYTLIVFDPMYRLLPRGASEAGDQDMREMFDRLTRAADKADAALVVLHHTSKGRQGDKNNTDVGSGHGVMSRSTDIHATLLPAEKNKDRDVVTHSVLKASPRTFPPFVPRPLRKISQEVPAWQLDEEEDGERPTSHPEGQDLLEAMEFADRCARPSGEKKIIIVGRHLHMCGADGGKLTKARATVLFEKALDAGYIEPADGGDKRTRLFRRHANREEEQARHQQEDLVRAVEERGGANEKSD